MGFGNGESRVWGAFEISQRMTALIGWGGTANFTEAWVYNQAADTYAFDLDMAQKLREANPEASVISSAECWKLMVEGSGNRRRRSCRNCGII
jgi:cobalamin biosynthesis Mg chelatase CobN